MQYNDTSNNTGIVQLSETLSQLGPGGITNDTALLKRFTQLHNNAYKKVVSAIMKVDKNWRWDDSNYTDFPIATINLFSLQRDYTLPASSVGGNASTLYRINRVRVLDTSGNFYDLKLLPADWDETQSGAANAGVPIWYRLIGNSIRLSPIPLTGSVTLAGGLEVQFQRAFDEFVYTDTTQQPGFMDTYHDLICLDACATYLLPINTKLATEYFQLFAQRLELLQEDYAKKNDDVPSKLIAKYRSSR